MEMTPARSDKERVRRFFETLLTVGWPTMEMTPATSGKEWVRRFFATFLMLGLLVAVALAVYSRIRS